MSTGDTSKRLIAIYYQVKNYTQDENSSIDHMRSKLVGGTPMGGASSNGVGSSSFSGSSGGSSFGDAHGSSGSGGHAQAGGAGGYGGGAGSGGNSGQVMRAFSVPAQMTSTSLQLGKGVGQFQQVSEYKDAGSSWIVKETPQTTQLSGTESTNGVTRNVTDQLVSTVLTFSVPKDVQDLDWRVVAFDADGKKLVMIDGGSEAHQNKNGEKSFRAQVMAPAAQIGRVVLESRPLEWVTIPKVALVAGQGAQP